MLVGVMLGDGVHCAGDVVCAHLAVGKCGHPASVAVQTCDQALVGNSSGMDPPTTPPEHGVVFDRAGPHWAGPSRADRDRRTRLASVVSRY
jgi:hypothetical protein